MSFPILKSKPVLKKLLFIEVIKPKNSNSIKKRIFKLFFDLKIGKI